MMLASVGALSVALLAGARLIFDILGAGLESSLPTLPPKVMVIGLAYGVGWLTAMIAIRVYGNLVLPFIIHYMIWGCLIGYSVAKEASPQSSFFTSAFAPKAGK